MNEEDLQKNPLPEAVFLNRSQVWISYKNQVKRCHNCDQVGHFSRDCEFPRLGYGSTQKASDTRAPFLSGQMPVYEKPNQVNVLDHLALSSSGSNTVKEVDNDTNDGTKDTSSHSDLNANVGAQNGVTVSVGAQNDATVPSSSKSDLPQDGISAVKDSLTDVEFKIPDADSVPKKKQVLSSTPAKYKRQRHQSADGVSKKTKFVETLKPGMKQLSRSKGSLLDVDMIITPPAGFPKQNFIPIIPRRRLSAVVKQGAGLSVHNDSENINNMGFDLVGTGKVNKEDLSISIDTDGDVDDRNRTDWFNQEEKEEPPDIDAVD